MHFGILCLKFHAVFLPLEEIAPKYLCVCTAGSCKMWTGSNTAAYSCQTTNAAYC